MIDNYNDIINMPHHVSNKHPQMSIDERAAQFAPYAALTGHGDAIRETARLTDNSIELDEELKIALSEKIRIIKENINDMPEISFTYFIPDNKKQGGRYVCVTGNVKKIDEYNQKIILKNNLDISICDIIDVDGEIIRTYEE